MPPAPTALSKTPRPDLSFKAAKEPFGYCATYGFLSISQMLTNESAWRSEAETRATLKIWQVMQDCAAAGCRNEGILPEGQLPAAALYRQLCKNPDRPCATRCRCSIGSTSTPGRQRRKRPMRARGS